MSALLASAPAPARDRPTADPAPLWDRFKARYRHVHEVRRDRWRGAVRIHGRLVHCGYDPTARGAARLVAGYLRQRYGPDWAAACAERVRAARCESARLRHAPRPGRPYRLTRRPGGLRLEAWVRGQAVPVRRRLFPDEAQAAAYFEGWKYQTFGLFAPVELAAPKSPGRGG